MRGKAQDDFRDSGIPRSARDFLDFDANLVLENHFVAPEVSASAVPWAAMQGKPLERLPDAALKGIAHIQPFFSRLRSQNPSNGCVITCSAYFRDAM